MYFRHLRGSSVDRGFQTFDRPKPSPDYAVVFSGVYQGELSDEGPEIALESFIFNLNAVNQLPDGLILQSVHDFHHEVVYRFRIRITYLGCFLGDIAKMSLFRLREVLDQIEYVRFSDDLLNFSSAAFKALR